MPAKTTVELRKRAAALKKKLAEKGASLDGTKRRALAKRIRRVQRKRRRGEVASARSAGAKETTESPRS